MIVESARVISISKDALWVEAVQRSTCGSCVAEKGCGQRLLARLSGKTMRLRVLPGERSLMDYRVGESVEIGIPEDVVVRGSLLVYILPLMMMILSAWFGHQWFAVETYLIPSTQALLHQELAAIAFACGGLFVGAGIVRGFSKRMAGNTRAQPLVIQQEKMQSELRPLQIVQ